MDRRTAVFILRAAGGTVCLTLSCAAAYAMGFGIEYAMRQWFGVFSILTGGGAFVLWCGAFLAATGDYYR
jgi:hypothetical protein